MARSIDSTLQIARQVMQSSSAWLLFVEIDADVGKFRMVNNAQHLEANGFRWQAADISIELPIEDAEGGLGELAIAIPNVSRIPIFYVDSEDDILGKSITIYLQLEGNLDSFEEELSWTHVCLSAEVSERTARFRCGHAAQNQRVPGPLFDRVAFPQLLASGGISL